VAETQSIGRVAVRVLPDVSKFRDDAVRELRGALRGISVNVAIRPDMDSFRERVEAASRGVVARVRVVWVPVAAILRRGLERLVAEASRGVRADVEVGLNGRALACPTALRKPTLAAGFGQGCR
jgi:phosphatidylserine/phosphatidylglycerophosphate/cardiolipin synthase-like enzyme